MEYIYIYPPLYIPHMVPSLFFSFFFFFLLLLLPTFPQHNTDGGNVYWPSHDCDTASASLFAIISMMGARFASVSSSPSTSGADTMHHAPK